MPEWVQGFRNRGEVLEHATAHALADAAFMKALGDRLSKAHLHHVYDIDIADVENVMEAFIRTYLDPGGLRQDEPVENLEGDSGVLGAFFVGMLAGWRYCHTNDHTFKTPDDEECEGDE
jgi:hypothetical protein